MVPLQLNVISKTVYFRCLPLIQLIPTPMPSDSEPARFTSSRYLFWDFSFRGGNNHIMGKSPEGLQAHVNHCTVRCCGDTNAAYNKCICSNPVIFPFRIVTQDFPTTSCNGGPFQRILCYIATQIAFKLESQILRESPIKLLSVLALPQSTQYMGRFSTSTTLSICDWTFCA